jgi:hypothetical protein
MRLDILSGEQGSSCALEHTLRQPRSSIDTLSIGHAPITSGSRVPD